MGSTPLNPNLLIDPEDLRDLSFDWELTHYSSASKSYHTVRITTPFILDGHKISVVIFRESHQPIHLWVQSTSGLTLRYPESPTKRSELADTINEIFFSPWWVKVRKRLQYIKNIKLTPYEAIVTLDKIIDEVNQIWGLTTTMGRFMTEWEADNREYTLKNVVHAHMNPLAINAYQGNFSSYHKQRALVFESFFWNRPTIRGYLPKYNLGQISVVRGNQLTKKVERMSYEDFLKTIEGFSMGDLINLLEKYGWEPTKFFWLWADKKKKWDYLTRRAHMVLHKGVDHFYT